MHSAAHSDLDERLKSMEEKMDALLEGQSLGDWISEEQANRLTGLKKSSLYELRRQGKITSSTISGKGVFYRKSDFERLLDKNEKL